MSGLMQGDDEKNTTLDSFLRDLQHLNEDKFRKVTELWNCIYGPDESNLPQRIEKVKNDLLQFWEYQIERQEERKQSLMKSIEQTGKEAFDLEKALGLDVGMDNSLHSDVPLVEWEEQIWKLLSSYQEMKELRITEYARLQEKEKDLCTLLDYQTEFLINSDSPDSTRVPSSEDVANCKERIKNLKGLKDQLEYDFERYKDELRSLLQECEILPFSKVERFAAASSNEDIIFPVTKKNFDKLKSVTQEYRTKKEHMMAETNNLRQEIATISKKIMKDPVEVEHFLNQHSGFTKSILDRLKQELKALKDERKLKLKDLILSQRNLLDEWWTQCCYSDEQRAQFRPYQVDYYTEEVLNFHELEVEQLEMFYNEHKRIFHLAHKFNEMWKRLLQLEDESSQIDRLFNNRGGRLLQEEKERKLIQKKVPAIKSELEALLSGYKESTGKDFLHFGRPLQETLKQMEEEREMSKENQKLQRKVANTENVLLESRLGSRPVSGNKRKLLTPKQPIGSSKVMKMSGHSTTSSTTSVKSSASSGYGKKNLLREEPSAVRARLRSPAPSGYATLRTPVKGPTASTPDNGSPSYESFQEHIEKSRVKDICHSSMKNPTMRVLRPRNNVTNIVTPKLTPYKTPKTPVRTPSKIPFRIATGSKIPTTVPPVSPRSVSKLTTPRSKLPLIF